MAITGLKEFENYGAKDYLSFDEVSMRDLLIRFLSRSGVYTDQIFPGSDISVFIDIASYMFAQLTYIANGNAAEATFSEAQFYENINRLCKLLGYSPRGFSTATAECKIVINSSRYNSRFGNVQEAAVRGIPRYTSYKIGDKTYSLASGEAGSSYSDYQQFSFSVDFINGNPVVTNSDNPVLLNGRWKLYSAQPVATGTQRETFIMSATSDLIAYPFIDVYVYDPLAATSSDPNAPAAYTRWIPVQDLYDSGPTDRVYSIRVNENKQYEISFGDGVNGARLGAGQMLYIVYLVSDGEAGSLTVGELDGTQQLTVEIEGLTAAEIKEICFGGPTSFDREFTLFTTAGSLIYSDIISLENIAASSDPVDFETVESIRFNAPRHFRSQGRLVTKKDYENFVLENYSSSIRDCRVMNNFSYCAEFQDYLRRYGKLTVQVRQYNYRFSDACDHNNIYLWLRSMTSGNTSSYIKRAILNDTYKLKCVGDEPIPLDALAMVFSPYAAGDYPTTNWDPTNENKIVIIKDQTSLVNNDRVREVVVEKIINFFSPENQRIGAALSIQNLQAEILGVDGVKEIYTARIVSDTEIARVSGLSFAHWTPLILQGADLGVANNATVKLPSFSYAELRKSNIFSQLVLIKSNSLLITSPEY